MLHKIIKVDVALKPAVSSFTKNMALAIAQILLWAGSFFIISVLGAPIMKETGWSQQMVYGVLSLSLFVWGILSAFIGKMIHRSAHDGILSYSGVVMAAGLIIIGLAHSFVVFACGWLVIGVAMAMGLYDALFASLGKKYGNNANQSIVQITVISGFAPTVSWVSVSFLVSHFGWRNACFLYALILLFAIFPLYRWAFGSSVKKANSVYEKSMTETAPHVPLRSPVFYLLLLYFTIGAILMTGMEVHLIEILLTKNMPMATAISIAALLGPSQVGTRVLDMVLPKRTPQKTAIVTACAIFAGLLLLAAHPKIAFLGIIIFGLGNGMRTILKGILPMSVFGQKDYALIVGKLGGLPLFAQAATPFVGSFLIQQFSVPVFLGILCLLAFVNIFVAVLIRSKINQ